MIKKLYIRYYDRLYYGFGSVETAGGGYEGGRVLIISAAFWECRRFAGWSAKALDSIASLLKIITKGGTHRKSISKKWLVPARVLKEILKVVYQIGRRADGFNTGESGTGKNYRGDWFIYNSPRKDKPLIKITVPLCWKSDWEWASWAWKGAFTGATQRKAGRYWIRLTRYDIPWRGGDISPHLQVKLLRFCRRGIERVEAQRL